MNDDFLWMPNPDVRKRLVADNILLFNVKTNQLLLINDQASFIWDQFRPLSYLRNSELLSLLAREYESAPQEVLRSDVDDFLRDLENQGFIRCDGESFKTQGVDIKDGQDDKLGHFAFSESLHNVAAELKVPISGCIEITQRCPLRCLHCYISNKPAIKGQELTTGEIMDLLDQMAECGCLWLLITGGEPLIRKDFCEIYLHAKNLGMIITVFTGAINLDEKIIKLFSEYPPFLVEATLHGVTEKTFDAITGIDGSFQKFQRGIKLLRESKIPFHLKMIVMRQNVQEVEAAHKLALDLGADDFRFDSMINADFHHSPKARELRISVEDALKLDLIEPYKNRWQRIYRNALAKKKESRKNYLFPCRAGRCSFTISADGYLLPCILMRTPSYNLRQMSFGEGWASLTSRVDKLRMSKNNLCLQCSVKTCSKCPAWGYLEHDNPNSKSLFACTLQREREKIFLP